MAKSKSIAKWQQEVHELAKAKGWYDSNLPPRSALEVHMLIVSEIAEATEEARRDEFPVYQMVPENCPVPYSFVNTRPQDEDWDPAIKPEGELIELADAVIRILDYCGSKGWDLEEAIRLKHEYNKTRPHRHGGKRY